MIRGKTVNKYEKLAKNTAIFAVGTFGSKILSFIMVFFYSRAMQTAEFGMLDIIINSGSLMIPIAMLGITNAVIRFGLDDDYNNKDVITSAFAAIGLGFSVLLLACPFIMLIDDLKQYIVLLYAHVLMSAFRHVCSFFVRADKRMTLYAADGVFSTFMTCLLTIIFLIPLRMGIVGYMLAIILADFCSVIFLCSFGKVFPRISFKGFNKNLCAKMIRFALPLMPTSLLWWVVNVSDRYFVKFMISDSANGLYAAAYKVPTILTLVSAIFLDAWQISAVSENKSKEKDEFYSSVFRSFQGGIFMVGAFLIIFAKLITKILLAESYYLSWQYIPTLIFATVFSCFVVFLGNIYLAESKNVATLTTTIAGAVLNLILNYFLIPVFGANGAAIATLVSYFIVFLLRALDLKYRVKSKVNFCFFKVLINSIFMIVQTAIMIAEPKNWLIFELGIILITIVFNINVLLPLIKKVLRVK